MEELQSRLQEYNWGLFLHQNFAEQLWQYSLELLRQACELTTSSIKYFYKNNDSFLMR